MDISTGFIQNVEQKIILSNGTRLPVRILHFASGSCIADCLRPTSSGNEFMISTRNWTGIVDVDCSLYGDLGSLLGTECVQSAGYQWGFSRPWILTISSLFLIWGIAICGIWIDTANCSRFYQQGIDLGIWKTIFDVGEAMRQVLYQV